MKIGAYVVLRPLSWLPVFVHRNAMFYSEFQLNRKAHFTGTPIESAELVSDRTLYAEPHMRAYLIKYS